MKLHCLPLAPLCAMLLLSPVGRLRAQDVTLAPDDIKNYKALVDKGHMSARVELRTGEKSYLHYRYDCYPGVERMILEDGSTFARVDGKEWMKSEDWGKTGTAAGDDASAELNNFVGVVNSAFTEPVFHDMSQGGTQWRFIEKSAGDGFESFTYERSREKPHPDGVYPQYTFIKHEGDTDGQLTLAQTAGQLKSDTKEIPFTINYDYSPEKIAQAQPEELLATGKKIADSKPEKVSVLATGDANCRVAGIVSGKDFDLTVQKPEGAYREIAVGKESWRSDDAGKTWKKEKKTDRRYYDLAHAPIHYVPNEAIPPFEAMVADGEEAGEGLRHIRFKAPDRVAYQGDRANYWFTMKDDGTPLIRHFNGPLVFDNKYVITFVEYQDVAGGKGVLPPPGNPDAVPPPGPEAMLAKAIAQMQTGVWKVDAHAEFTKKVKITGWISGADFDLTETPEDGSAGIRQIAIGSKSWGSSDNGVTWKPKQADDRFMYNLLHASLDTDRVQPAFETVETADHDGETWLHIREKENKKVDSEKDRPNCWILLDKDGQPVSVRRVAGYVMMDDTAVYCEADYTRAAAGEEIKPPAGK
jgi:hypothetical protein